MTARSTGEQMRYTYTGDEVYWLWPTSFQEGFSDGLFYLPKFDSSNLYRYPTWKKISWRLGYWLGRISRWLGDISLTRRPRKPAKESK